MLLFKLLIMASWRFDVVRNSHTKSVQSKRKHGKCEHIF